MRRFRVIASILMKYGFKDWLGHIHLRPRLRRRKAVKSGIGGDAGRARNIRMAIEEMGPVYVKFGQLISTRRDIIPSDYIRELSLLQDDVLPLKPEVIQKTLQEHMPHFNRIRDFNPEPEASASIAQVHRGHVHGIGDVAIKIQRPGISEIIEEDMQILSWFALQVEHYIPALRGLQPVNLVREFAKTLRREINFRYEAENILRFRKNFAGSKSIMVPRVYPELSSDNILVMEFVSGKKLSKLLREPERLTTAERSRIARAGSRAIIEQVFVHAFFHADPHPGNILIHSSGKLCFLDFGIMGQISPVELEKMHQAIISLTSNDYERLVEILLSLLGHRGQVDYELLRSDIFEIIDRYINLPLESIQVPRAIQELLGIISTHNLSIPSKFLLMNKAIVTIEGVAKDLEPSFTMSSIMGVVVRRVVQQQFNPGRARRAMVELSADYSSLGREFPREARDILKQLRRGRLGIEFKIEGIEPLRKTLDQVGSRIIFGLLLTAVMVSSAMIFSAGLPPLWNGMPIVGLTGFAIAILMAGYYLGNLILRYFRNRWK